MCAYVSEEVDAKELKSLLEQLASGTVSPGGLASRVAQLASLLDPAWAPPAALYDAVVLCLNSVWRRTINLTTLEIDPNRLVTFLALLVEYLYPAIERVRSGPAASLHGALDRYRHREVAVLMADMSHLALVAGDGNLEAAASFRRSHDKELRRITREWSASTAPMIVCNNTVRRRKERAIKLLVRALNRLMANYGI